MAGVSFTTHVEEFKAHIGQQVENGLFYAGDEMKDFWKEKLNIAVVKVDRKRTRDTSRGPKGSGYKEVTQRSLPGEFPRKDTGMGQQSVFNRAVGPNKRQVGVGGNAPYMAILELSMNRLGSVAALEKDRERIAKAFEIGCKQTA